MLNQTLKLLRSVFPKFISIYLALYITASPLLVLSSSSVFAQDVVGETPIVQEEGTPTPEVEVVETPVVEEIPEVVTPEPEETPVVEEETPVLPVVEESEEETTTEEEVVEVSIVDSGTGALNTLVENVLYDCNAASTISCVTTDKADYAPTGLVKLSGYTYSADTQYLLVVYSNDDPDVRHEVVVTTDENGDFYHEYKLDGNYRPQYYVEVHSFDVENPLLTSIVSTGSFTDANPSASLSQYANDVPLEWVNGNLGASKSTYYEGDVIPYRLVFDNLDTSGSRVVTIEWDTTKSGKHSIDYITTYNTTESANPCLGLSASICSSSSTFPIPVDPQVSGAGVTQIPGNFTLYGGTITGVSAYTYDQAGFLGDREAKISITFTASIEEPVLVWGGHIATRSDWGANNSAISITGSPYHTRLIDLDGSGGNQDRSLSADAVIFPASITIVKQSNVEGNTVFPFTASPSPLTNFNLVDDGTSANTKVFSNILDFKEYVVTEGTSSLWSLDAVNCLVSTPNGGSQDIDDNQVTIDLEEGENVTCTFENSINSADLTVVKNVVNDNGGNATVSAFEIKMNNSLLSFGSGNTVGSTTTYTATPEVVTNTQYTLTENTNVSGYTAGTWSCVDDNTQQSVSNPLSLTSAQSVTCTITNNDIAPSLTVVKEVVNDDGGNAVVGDFDIEMNDNNLSFGSGSVNGDTTTYTSTPSVSSNTSYTLTEDENVAGYDAGTWSCVDDNAQQSVNHPLSLNEGQSVTCTITNDDIAPSLTVVKDVVNDNGGNAVVGDFDIEMNDNDLSFGTGSVNGDTTSYTATPEVEANTQYTLTEDENVAGYDAGTWSCVDDNTDQAVSNPLTLSEGQSVTCEISNNDIAPSLTVIKDVINDNGGNAVVADFDIEMNDNNLSFGSGSVNGSTTTYTSTPDVDSNVAYTLTEDENVAGYDAGTWVCTDDNTDELLDNTVTLNEGQSVTCKIVNNDIAPTLTVVKEVVNDDGGNAVVTDFDIEMNDNDLSFGTGDVDGSTTTYTSTPSVSSNSSYELTEDESVPGYIAGTWSCIDNDTKQSIDNPLTLNEGQDVTCTITNNDVKPGLTVIKEVVNDDGGNAVVSEFEITMNDGLLSFEEGEVNGDTTSYTSNPDVDSNVAYTLAENENVAGYDAGTWSCVDSNTQQTVSNPVTLAEGQNVTCTITNNDVAPTLTVIKEVVNDNGGTAVVEDFNITLNEEGLTFGEGDVDGDTTSYTSTPSVEANLPYELDEDTEFAGYVAGDWVCVDNDTENEVDIEEGLNEGQNVTCTIVNDDIAPTLTVVKHVVNDNGGTSTVGDFDIKLNEDDLFFGLVETEGDTTSYTATPKDNPVVANELYELSEDTSVDYYNAGTWSCVDTQTEQEVSNPFTLTNGQNVECEITNDDIEPRLEIEKDNNAVGDKEVGDSVEYTIKVNVKDAAVHGLEVTDFVPDAFGFVLGSTTVKVDGVANYNASLVPTYNDGKGLWDLSDLGTLVPGTVVTLTYLAEVTVDADPGLYKDIAWAKATEGEGFDEQILSGIMIAEFNEETDLLALAVGANVQDTNFVGTQVNVVSTEIEEDGVVLGVQELPSTGMNAFQAIIAMVLVAFGLLLTAYGLGFKRNMKNLVVSTLVAGVMFASLSSQSLAATTLLRVEEPASTTNTTFTLDYTVSDLLEDPAGVEVTCLVMKPGEVAFSSFEMATTPQGGASGKCEVDNSVLTAGDGVYTFKVDTNKTGESTPFNVDFDTTAPGTPTNYGKSAQGVCQNKVTFRTAADSGETVKVEVFRSTAQTFTANASSFAGEVAIGSNTNGSFVDDKPNCNASYNYAVRAVDTAGNTSDFVGDTIVVVVPGENTGTDNGGDVDGATDNGNTGNNNNGNDDDGEVAGEDDEEKPSDNENPDGEVSGEDDQSKDENKTIFERFTSNWVSVLSWVIGIVLGIIVLWQLSNRGILQAIFQKIMRR